MIGIPVREDEPNVLVDLWRKFSGKFFGASDCEQKSGLHIVKIILN